MGGIIRCDGGGSQKKRKKRIYSYVIFYGGGNLHELGMYPVHAGWEPIKYVNSHNKIAPEMNLKINDIMNNVFINISKEEDNIYTPTIAEIVHGQSKDRKYKKYFKPVLDFKRDKKSLSRL